MRLEVFWTVTGNRSVVTRAVELKDELWCRGIPMREEIEVTRPHDV